MVNVIDENFQSPDNLSLLVPQCSTCLLRSTFTSKWTHFSSFMTFLYCYLYLHLHGGQKSAFIVHSNAASDIKLVFLNVMECWLWTLSNLSKERKQGCIRVTPKQADFYLITLNQKALSIIRFISLDCISRNVMKNAFSFFCNMLTKLFNCIFSNVMYCTLKQLHGDFEIPIVLLCAPLSASDG